MLSTTVEMYVARKLITDILKFLDKNVLFNIIFSTNSSLFTGQKSHTPSIIYIKVETNISKRRT
jgi:hypothetical protein